MQSNPRISGDTPILRFDRIQIKISLGAPWAEAKNFYSLLRNESDFYSKLPTYITKLRSNSDTILPLTALASKTGPANPSRDKLPIDPSNNII